MRPHLKADSPATHCHRAVVRSGMITPMRASGEGDGTRTAIVTGGTGGLGSAVTRRFLDASWRTVVPWYDERELGRLDSHPLLTLVQADLFDPTSAAECAAAG